MTSAQVVETSVTNNSSFQNYPHPDDHTIRNTSTNFDETIVSPSETRTFLDHNLLAKRHFRLFSPWRNFRAGYSWAASYSVIREKKVICFRPGSNRRPSACKADVITTTLRKPVTKERCHFQWCVNRKLVVFRFLTRKTGKISPGSILNSWKFNIFSRCPIFMFFFFKTTTLSLLYATYRESRTG